MIRTGAEYRDSIRDGRAVYIDGERVRDVTRHPSFKLPYTEQDWWDKRRATDTVLEEIGGVVTRVGDETVGEMWSLFDGQDILNEVDPQFGKNIAAAIEKVIYRDPFHVSANTDPKGDRSKPPQQQDPD